MTSTEWSPRVWSRYCDQLVGMCTSPCILRHTQRQVSKQFNAGQERLDDGCLSKATLLLLPYGRNCSPSVGIRDSATTGAAAAVACLRLTQNNIWLTRLPAKKFTVSLTYLQACIWFVSVMSAVSASRCLPRLCYAVSEGESPVWELMHTSAGKASWPFATTAASWTTTAAACYTSTWFRPWHRPI